MTQVNNPLAIKTYSSDKYNLTGSILNESDDISWRFYKLLDPSKNKLKMLDVKNGYLLFDYKKLLKNISKYGTIDPSGPILDTPSEIKLSLKTHQKRTLFEMLKRENCRYRFVDDWNVNLLCDNVGSGKSLCILSLIAEQRIANISSDMYYSSKPYNSSYSNNYYGYNYDLGRSLSIDDSAIELKSNLIVVPHNVFNQWNNYIDTFTTLKVYVIATNKSIKQFTSSIENVKSVTDNYPIILVKSTMYKSLHKHLNSLKHSYSKTTYIDQISKNTYSSFKDQIDYLDKASRDIVKTMMNGSNPNMSLEDKTQMKEKLSKLRDSIDCILNKTDWANLGSNSHIRNCTTHNTIFGFYFQRIIVDEVDSIRIPAFPFMYSKQIWYISSSINNLLYPNGRKTWNYDTSSYKVISTGIKGTGFLKDILINMFGRKGSYNWTSKLQAFRTIFTVVRNNIDFVNDSIKIPEPVVNYIKCFTPVHLLAISSAIDSDALKALNAGDTDKAVEILGCEQCSEESLVEQVTKKIRDKKDKVEAILTEKQSQLDNVKLEYENIKTLMNSLVNDEGECSDIETYSIVSVQKQDAKNKKNNLKVSIKQYKVQLKDLNNKIDGIESRIVGAEDKKCPICYMNVEGPCITPCCKNVFCLECLTMAINTSSRKECPLCRSKINMKDVNIIVSDKTKKAEIQDQLPNKMDKLIEIVTGNPTKRFMIFSEFEGGINRIRNKMDKNNIKYSGIKGSASSIEKKINAFRNKEFNVLLLNAKFFGAGLNLQFTDEIIIYHRMSKDLENQVIGRAQRIGRTDPLKINYLCFENEYTQST